SRIVFQFWQSRVLGLCHHEPGLIFEYSIAKLSSVCADRFEAIEEPSIPGGFVPEHHPSGNFPACFSAPLQGCDPLVRSSTYYAEHPAEALNQEEQ
ncbi:MAG TPA: hypothetical protein VMM37_08010, partial [Bacteroidota bacterium]|nr:hypothetical protein [Bacteroidota bacterium]